MGEIFQNFPVPVPDGLRLPNSPIAGDMVIYAKQGLGSGGAGAYAYCGTGWGFVAAAAATLRVSYSISVRQGYYSYAKLMRNGADVSDSVISSNSYYAAKTIDVTVSPGDRVELWAMYEVKGEFSGVCNVHKFEVCILAPELQNTVKAILSPT
ncbi:MAG TPA: hypothetical protein VN608_09455 [Clostridia bacterium]|nr:hypothetical protein [Clostridia bacterium]